MGEFELISILCLFVNQTTFENCRTSGTTSVRRPLRGWHDALRQKVSILIATLMVALEGVGTGQHLGSKIDANSSWI